MFLHRYILGISNLTSTALVCKNWPCRTVVFCSFCFFCFCVTCTSRTNPLEMFSVQHSPWKLLLAAPNFTSLKGFLLFFLFCFVFLTHFYLLVLATDPLVATAAAYQHEDFTNPGSHWNVLARLFPSVPSLFEDLRRLRWCSYLPTPPAITDQAVFVAFFHFIASLFSFPLLQIC